MTHIQRLREGSPCVGASDLVRHLESFGLICSYAGDIATGQDALTIPIFNSPVITNPPYERKLMHALTRHFIATAPCCWLLLESDWLWTKQAKPFLPHASDVVTIGRLKWIEGSPSNGFDNYAWLRFSSEHRAGPILHSDSGSPKRTATCAGSWCGRSFVPARTDTRYCSSACRQRAFTQRLAVTEP
jgi:hypothetical protein